MVGDPQDPTRPAPDVELPLVSVIVPTHGRPDLLRATLRAIVDQTYAGEIECVVVHDREPADHGLTALSTDRRTVRVVTNHCAPGLAGARNTGLEETRGDLVAGCDDDDRWHATKIERQVGRMLADPELMVLGTGLHLVFPGRSVDWPARGEVIDPGFVLRNRVKELHSSTMLIRRELIARIGRYDEDLPNGHAEDYDFVLRAAAAGKIGCVIEPLADIRKDVQSFYQGKAATTAAALQMLLAKHPEIESSRRGHARLLGHIAWATSTAGDRRMALRHAVRALRRWPMTPHAHLAVLHAVTRVPPQRVLQVTRLFGRGLT
jgi:glycosyltransferase involved in cell wall biosynthesis